ncbi:MAG: hypothetical protein DRP15_01490, partial [Candidatus Aenigmatarchaeota archaeon]
VLTIFGKGIIPIGSLTEFTNNCKLQCKTACETTGSPPPTWSLKVLVPGGGGEKRSCSEVSTCDCGTQSTGENQKKTWRHGGSCTQKELELYDCVDKNDGCYC